MHPVILNSLAHPSGIALYKGEGSSNISQQSTLIFVCETLRNRLLRGARTPSGVWHFSVFHQFAGTLGPASIAIHPESGYIYVGMFDFPGPHNENDTGII